MEIIEAIDGEFELRDGSGGNPGCDCGMYDAVLCIDGDYYCESAYEEWLEENE